MRKTPKYTYLFLALFFLLVAFYIVSFNLRVQRERKQYAWPPHFDYYGNTYVNRGYLVYALPEGFELVGEVTDIGNCYEREDLEGNIDGYAYMNPEEPDVAYFQWQEWDESVDGEEPYLRFDQEEDF